ncbi:hypothetical protein BG004_002501 [Podila humilis]|nr:hypothetical protein BG004_002501 [Podila humilis]
MTKRTTTTLLAMVAMALLAAMVEAHSWADCVDWRFNDPKKPGWTERHGKCFGWARQYPAKSKVRFGGLDSASPNRHYQQNPRDFTACSDGVHGEEPGSDETRQNPISRAYGGRFGTMASVRAGDEICVRWPAKNHAVPNERDKGVFINMPETVTSKDPSQSQFNKMNIAKLPYKNCNHIKGDTDHTPCGGCFKIPADRKTGTYVVQWRWELNDDEWYTSCWDLRVQGRAPKPKPKPTTTTTTNAALPTTTAPTKSPVSPASKEEEDDGEETLPLGGGTSVFAHLATWD